MVDGEAPDVVLTCANFTDEVKCGVRSGAMLGMMRPEHVAAVNVSHRQYTDGKSVDDMPTHLQDMALRGSNRVYGLET